MSFICVCEICSCIVSQVNCKQLLWALSIVWNVSLFVWSEALRVVFVSLGVFLPGSCSMKLKVPEVILIVCSYLLSND